MKLDKGGMISLCAEPFAVAMVAHGFGLGPWRSVTFAVIMVAYQFASSIAISVYLGRFWPIFNETRRELLWGGTPPKPSRVKRLSRVNIGRSSRARSK